MPSLESIEEQKVDFPGGAFRIAGATDVGIVRRVNQDAYSIFLDPDRRELLLVVADGLGGHRGGEVASRLAVDAIGREVRKASGEPDERLRSAVLAANRDILEAAHDDPALVGMGTTIVVVLLADTGSSFVAHVGDSRLYRLRGEHVDALTEDHSLVATLVREGVLSIEEARVDPRRNQILRALGVRADLEVDVAPIQMLPGDRYLLCSDGLHGLVDDDEIRTLAASDREPAGIVRSLIDAANERGGTDNITCLVASLPEPTVFPTIRAGAERFLATTRSIFRKARS